MRIAIFGTVGAGKTTLINNIHKLLPNYVIYNEPLSDNPYFGTLYTAQKDVQSLTYKMEIFMLSARMKQLEDSKNEKDVIYDRGVMDTIVFADTNHRLGKIDDKDWNVYSEYFETCTVPSLFAKGHESYDLIVYLRVSSEKSIERIKKRGIKDEQVVDPKFWEMLNEDYDKWYEILKDKAPWLVLDGNTDNQEQLAQQVVDYINKNAKN